MFKLILFILIVLILGLIFYSFLANPPYFTEEFTNKDANSTSNNNGPINNLVYQPPSANSTSNSTPINNLVYQPPSSKNANNYHNYNHYTGSSSPISPGTYYEKNGSVIKVNPTANGNMNLHEQNPNNQATNIYTPSSNNTYFGNNGSTASIVDLNGQQAIEVNTSSGNKYIYTLTPPIISNNITSTQYFGSTGSTVPESNYHLAYTNSNNATNNYKTIFTGPNGAQAIVNSNNSITLTENGTTTNFSSVNNSPTSFTSNTGETLNVVKQGNGVVLKLTEPNGNVDIFTNAWFSGDNDNEGNTQADYNAYSNFPFKSNLMEGFTSNFYTNGNMNWMDMSMNYQNDNLNWLDMSMNNLNKNINSLNPFSSKNTYSSKNPYNSVYPQGVSKSQIPPGEENLYILKSEIVPPVCPACPQTTICPTKKEKPPPCPPCERCPEPDYSCKLVPNYGASEYQSAYYGSSGSSCNYKPSSKRKTLPVPVNNYSTYGM